MTLLSAAVLSGCATTARDPNLLYGIGDDELHRLGQHFGYQVDAMGMSEYSFTRGRRVFHVWAHRDISARHLQADMPVVLTYDPPGPRPPIESQLSVAHGVPYAAVEQHFRRFIERIESPSSHL